MIMIDCIEDDTEVSRYSLPLQDISLPRCNCISIFDLPQVLLHEGEFLVEGLFLAQLVADMDQYEYRARESTHLSRHRYCEWH